MGLVVLGIEDAGNQMSGNLAVIAGDISATAEVVNGDMSGDLTIIEGDIHAFHVGNVMEGDLPVFIETGPDPVVGDGYSVMTATNNNCYIAGNLPVVSGKMLCGANLTVDETPIIAGEIFGSPIIVGNLSSNLPIIKGSLFTGTQLYGSVPILSGDMQASVSIVGSIDSRLAIIAGNMSAVVDIVADIKGNLPIIHGRMSVETTIVGTISGSLPAIHGTISSLHGISCSLESKLPTVSQKSRMYSSIVPIGEITGELPVIAGFMQVEIDQETVLQFRDCSGETS